MVECQALCDRLRERLGSAISEYVIAVNEVTIEVQSHHLLDVCYQLRDDPEFQFEMLMDVCGVDYLNYGVSDWSTEDATETAFSRGVSTYPPKPEQTTWDKPRFAVVYHLLSLAHNQRLRMKVFLVENSLIIPSVVAVWNSANWFEREAFDLFGILFDGHPDLRRILTDYGFVGHPFRKDFPLIGNVEMRYSAKEGRVIYQPVSIPPRTLVPKTIRDDNRYLGKPPSE
jgi:NADH-quinone oxidoreductase subunit C